MVDFRAIINKLVDIGFYNVFLPFILVYVIVFAILEKSGIFKKSNNEDSGQTKNVNSVIAFVFALFVVASIQTVIYIQSLIINIVLFIVFILCVLILLGFVLGEGYTELFKNKWVKGGVATIIFLVSLVILLNLLGFWDWLSDYSFGDADTWVSILVFAGIIGVLVWVTKSDGKAVEHHK